MENIAVSKPDMGVLSRGRLPLTPFGALSQALTQEILARAGQEEGVYPYVPLDLLEEGEEGPQPQRAPAQTAVIQVELKLILKALQGAEKSEKERIETVQRILERTARLYTELPAPPHGAAGAPSRPAGRPTHVAAAQAPQSASGSRPAGSSASPSAPPAQSAPAGKEENGPAAAPERARGAARKPEKTAVPSRKETAPGLPAHPKAAEASASARRGRDTRREAHQSVDQTVDQSLSQNFYQRFYQTIHQHIRFFAALPGARAAGLTDVDTDRSAPDGSQPGAAQPAGGLAASALPAGRGPGGDLTGELQYAAPAAETEQRFSRPGALARRTEAFSRRLELLRAEGQPFPAPTQNISPSVGAAEPQAAAAVHRTGSESPADGRAVPPAGPESGKETAAPAQSGPELAAAAQGESAPPVSVPEAAGGTDPFLAQTGVPIGETAALRGAEAMGTAPSPETGTNLPAQWAAAPDGAELFHPSESAAPVTPPARDPALLRAARQAAGQSVRLPETVPQTETRPPEPPAQRRQDGGAPIPPAAEAEQAGGLTPAERAALDAAAGEELIFHAEPPESAAAPVPEWADAISPAGRVTPAAKPKSGDTETLSAQRFPAVQTAPVREQAGSLTPVERAALDAAAGEELIFRAEPPKSAAAPVLERADAISPAERATPAAKPESGDTETLSAQRSPAVQTAPVREQAGSLTPAERAALDAAAGQELIFRAEPPENAAAAERRGPASRAPASKAEKSAPSGKVAEQVPAARVIPAAQPEPGGVETLSAQRSPAVQTAPAREQAGSLTPAERAALDAAGQELIFRAEPSESAAAPVSERADAISPAERATPAAKPEPGGAEALSAQRSPAVQTAPAREQAGSLTPAERAALDAAAGEELIFRAEPPESAAAAAERRGPASRAPASKAEKSAPSGKAAGQVPPEASAPKPALPSPGEAVLSPAARDIRVTGRASARGKTSGPPKPPVSRPAGTADAFQQQILAVTEKAAGTQMVLPAPPRAVPAPGRPLPPEELAQSEAGAALSAVRQIASGPEPVELAYGQAASLPPFPQGQAASGLSGRLSAVQAQAWARQLSPEGTEEVSAGEAEPMAGITAARNISSQAAGAPPAGPFQAAPQSGQEMVTWTAPGWQPPAVPTQLKEPVRSGQTAQEQPQTVHVSDAEIRRTADQVYRIIEDRLRRERRRLGL